MTESSTLPVPPRHGRGDPAAERDWRSRLRLHDLAETNPTLAAHIRQRGDCWIGRCHINEDGYAKLGGRFLHRLVWAELVGPIAPGLVLDHREDWGCTSKACCFPGHLADVTNRANVLRGNSFSAVNARKNECDHGHKFDLFNTYYHRGRRCCRKCNSEAVARYKARRAGRAVPLKTAA